MLVLAGTPFGFQAVDQILEIARCGGQLLHPAGESFGLALGPLENHGLPLQEAIQPVFLGFEGRERGLALGALLSHPRSGLGEPGEVGGERVGLTLDLRPGCIQQNRTLDGLARAEREREQRLRRHPGPAQKSGHHIGELLPPPLERRRHPALVTLQRLQALVDLQDLLPMGLGGAGGLDLLGPDLGDLAGQRIGAASRIGQPLAVGGDRTLDLVQALWSGVLGTEAGSRNPRKKQQKER